ncbi:hypothetical protein PQA73_gp36 [Erwinia phage Pavtok]|uniref:Uncharacterized protein n=1 Tax=Erwinia phage Pavtok TaxID=2267655 RepID=A0A345BLZ3_9CAUD|nr:hypothetical protein PQA73_gp36 [Erwinia phage Pavtok]AXF51464.1 hypothetical protein PAVTOK_36 [Erwinia phage Pavtok]
MMNRKSVKGVTVTVTINTQSGDQRVLDLTHLFEEHATSMTIETTSRDGKGHGALEAAAFALNCALTDIERALEGAEGVRMDVRRPPAGKLDS